MEFNFETFVTGKLESIHEQVSKTNGRVQSLERWQAFIKGGITVLTIIVVPTVLYIIRGWIG